MRHVDLKTAGNWLADADRVKIENVGIMTVEKLVETLDGPKHNSQRKKLLKRLQWDETKVLESLVRARQEIAASTGTFSE